MLKLLYRKRDYCIILDTLTDTKYSMHKHNAYKLVNLGITIDGLHSLNNKTKEKKYAFVEDIRGVKLSPTHTNNAWKLIRLGRAKLISKEPMKIRLLREQDNTDTCEIRLGIDPGDTTGVAIVQVCKTHNKVIFKGEIQHRKDVSKRVEQRKNYRKFHRSQKRYRKPRFNNRASSRRSGRAAPSIKSRKDEILRLVNYFNKNLTLTNICCEDVAFDIRVLTDGFQPYGWQYQKSNRLDENIRKAVILRDNNTCKLCRAKNTRMEVHHITPRRENGINTLSNLITLCHDCHSKVTGNEDSYKDYLYNLIDGSNPTLKPAMHVMQGKTYLYKELSKIADLTLTTGGDTSNRRIDWNIPKTHSNDAICITNSQVNYKDTLIYEYKIRPRRKKSKVTQDTSNLEIKHGDIVYYKPRYRDKIKCYVIAILTSGTAVGKYKLKSFDGEMFGPISSRSLKKISCNNNSLLFA